MIGDGTYLMSPTELVTAVQEGLKVTVVLIVNHGYQSIHALQTAAVGESFGNEFRRRDGDRLDGDFVPIDFAANARSFGCAVFEADSEESFRDALSAARAERGTSVVVAARSSPGAGCSATAPGGTSAWRRPRGSRPRGGWRPSTRAAPSASGSTTRTARSPG